MADIETRRFERTISKAKELHEALDCCEDPAVELILKRKCADVSLAAYQLRTVGDRIAVEALESYDEVLKRSVDRMLGGDIEDMAWKQAAVGVRDGGLGFRRAARLALPAVLASRTAARPAATLLFRDLEASD